MQKINVAYINADNRYTQEEMDYYDNLSKEHMPNVKLSYYSSIQEFFPKLSNATFKVDFIVIDVEFLQSYSDANPYALIATLKTLAHSTLYRDSNGKTKKRDTKVIGVVGYESPVDIIKEMIPLVDALTLRMGGLWSGGVVLENQKRLLSGDLSMPKEIQCKLRKKLNRKTNEIKLTPRQRQVFRMIVKSGASNKIIARALSISESTVKLHIGSILKKYGLKNRTQLAVFVKDE